MIVSYRWLTSVLGQELPIHQLIDRLTMSGLEIEALHDLGVVSGKILVARILEIAPHPNADQLVLCRVDAGRTEPLRIVCGAKNMKEGDLVPLAVEGAELPCGVTIKRSKIRGETSEGMMCSARELGWSEDASGLLILPPDWVYQVGQPFDALLDIKVTPNRADCLSVLGVARDLAAALSLSAPRLSPRSLKEGTQPASDFASVRIDAPDGCPRYTGRVIRGVTIGPSPLWLARAVESAGMRSINNVVDVTNYILAELGHPLHAFDLDLVHEGTIIVRYAHEGESVRTLDGQEHSLLPSDLLIADPEKPIALAGIMGCGNTEIHEGTRNVFLECAYFHPPVIRRTSKRLAKVTESSYRFERGTDWSALDAIVDRAAALITEVAGGEICVGRFDVGPGVQPPQPIELSLPRCIAHSGLSLTIEQAAKPLHDLGFMVEILDSQTLRAVPPAIRHDVQREADLVEEIVRIVGYDNVPTVLPYVPSVASKPAPEDQLAAILRDVCVEHGLAEVMNYSFLSAEAIRRAGFDLDVAVPLGNPLSAEYALLRPSLVPGLLETVLFNQNHQAPDVHLFEIGKVFHRDATSETGFTEHWQFAAVLSGSEMARSWRSGPRPADFFDGKSLAVAILSRLCVDDVEAQPLADSPYLHPGKSAVLSRNGTPLLIVGQLHPRIRVACELKREPIFVIADFEPLLTLLENVPKYRDIPAFPVVARDLALVADRDVPASAIEDTIRKRAKSLLASCLLFDVYEGERIPAGKRSLAYQLRFSAPDRTLTDEEVNQLVQKIVSDLKAKLGVELRT